MQENKHISTGLAIAACVLSLAVHAADNEWQVSSGEGASTEWSNPLNWSLDLGNAENELRFRAGTGVANHDDVIVTFDGAYTYANRIKFENDENGNGVGLVTFRASDDAYGVTAENNNFLVGWHGGGGWPGNWRIESGYIKAGNAVLLQEGTLTVAGGTLETGNNFHTGYETSNGNSANTALNVYGGTVRVGGMLQLACKSGWTSVCTVTNGSLTTGGKIYVGNNGSGKLYVYGGDITCGNEFWIGNANGSSGYFEMTNGTFTSASYTCIGYGNASGTFVMKGGEFVENGGVFIVGQANIASAHGECIVSNGVIKAPNAYVSERAAPGTLTIEGGEVSVPGTVTLSRNNGAGLATVNLNGGTFSIGKIEVGSGAGAVVNFDGGTLMAAGAASAENWIPASDKLTVSLGENGAVFDTAGYAAAIPATINNASDITGNAPIAKKGLGTLTISSDLKLDRAFKFVIDGGVGPIALTGSANTLGEGKKISVEVDTVDFEFNTKYALLTGLDAAFTLDDSFNLPDDNGFCTLEWSLEDGELSVTPVGYASGAPVTARYVNSGWTFYDGNDEAIENGEASQYTSYVFTGVEPAGELASIAGAHNVIFEARRDGDNNVQNTILLSSDVNAKCITVRTDDGCQVRINASTDSVKLSVKKLVNDGDATVQVSDLSLGELVLSSGTFKLSGDNSYLIPVPSGDGALEINSDAETSLDITGSIAMTFMLKGEGVFKIKSGSGITFNSEYVEEFLGTVEVPSGAWFSAVKSGNRLQAGVCAYRFSGGTAWFSADANNEFTNRMEFVTGTSSTIQGGKSNLRLMGPISGSGTFSVEVNERGVQFSGDNSDFSGIANLNYGWPPNSMWNEFAHSYSASPSARWNLNCSHSGWYNNKTRNSYAFRDTSAENPMRFGALNVSASSTTITLNQETYVTVGERENDSSTINGRFVDNVVRLTKVGADSWLKLGTTFQMVDGSTLTVSAGGLAFNLPTDDTVTDLTGDTVTIDPSVKIRVAMTQAQYDALDLNEEYLVAKLPTNPRYKPETELLVDGTVLNTSAAARWCVRFKSFPAVGETPAYVGAVLCRRSAGLMIIVY